MRARYAGDKQDAKNLRSDVWNQSQACSDTVKTLICQSECDISARKWRFFPNADGLEIELLDGQAQHKRSDIRDMLDILFKAIPLNRLKRLYVSGKDTKPHRVWADQVALAICKSASLSGLTKVEIKPAITTQAADGIIKHLPQLEKLDVVVMSSKAEGHPAWQPMGCSSLVELNLQDPWDHHSQLKVDMRGLACSKKLRKVELLLWDVQHWEAVTELQELEELDLTRCDESSDDDHPCGGPKYSFAPDMISNRAASGINNPRAARFLMELPKLHTLCTDWDVDVAAWDWVASIKQLRKFECNTLELAPGSAASSSITKMEWGFKPHQVKSFQRPQPALQLQGLMKQGLAAGAVVLGCSAPPAGGPTGLNLPPSQPQQGGMQQPLAAGRPSGLFLPGGVCPVPIALPGGGMAFHLSPSQLQQGPELHALMGLAAAGGAAGAIMPGSTPTTMQQQVPVLLDCVLPNLDAAEVWLPPAAYPQLAASLAGHSKLRCLNVQGRGMPGGSSSSGNTETGGIADYEPVPGGSSGSTAGRAVADEEQVATGSSVAEQQHVAAQHDLLRSLPNLEEFGLTGQLPAAAADLDAVLQDAAQCSKLTMLTWSCTEYGTPRVPFTFTGAGASALATGPCKDSLIYVELAPPCGDTLPFEQLLPLHDMPLDLSLALSDEGQEQLLQRRMALMKSQQGDSTLQQDGLHLETSSSCDEDMAQQASSCGGAGVGAGQLQEQAIC